MSRTTRTEAFAIYKVKPSNTYWGLSARSEARGLVVISLWQDEIRGKAGRMFCERTSWGDWYNGPGRTPFLEDLLWASEHLDGLVRLVISTRTRTEKGWVRTESFARPDLLMRVVQVDLATGAFRLEQVVPEAKAA
jgi:hypothetical protein